MNIRNRNTNIQVSIQIIQDKILCIIHFYYIFALSHFCKLINNNYG